MFEKFFTPPVATENTGKSMYMTPAQTMINAYFSFNEEKLLCDIAEILNKLFDTSAPRKWTPSLNEVAQCVEANQVAPNLVIFIIRLHPAIESALRYHTVSQNFSCEKDEFVYSLSPLQGGITYMDQKPILPTSPENRYQIPVMPGSPMDRYNSPPNMCAPAPFVSLWRFEVEKLPRIPTE